MDMSLSTSETDRHSNDPADQPVDDIISQELNQLIKLDCNDENADIDDTHGNEHHDDDNDDFTFVFIGEDNSRIYVDKAFEDGQMFPLFDQKLLLDGTEYELEQVDQSLPFQPPVDKVFTELPRGFESSKNEDPDHEEAAGPFCAWSKDQSTSSSSTSDQLSKKSNSTGFSKLWRLREKVHRSNSDGRDAFVFLKSSDKTTSSSSSSSSKPVTSNHASHGTFVKVNNGNGTGTGKAKVVKKTTISAHEAYMRSRGGHTEERRKSYLPYRPELMGFFTNVHGGLSKNVHPY